MHLEKRYDALVEQLKYKICGVIILNQEEEYLEAEDIKKIDDEFVLYIRDGRFYESEEEESEHGEIDKDSKDEEKHMLCRKFDG